MSADTMTILQARGRRLTKLWHADGTSEGYDSAKHYDLHDVAVDSLDAVEAVLHQLHRRTDCAVVRGAIANPDHARRARRLVHPDPKTGDAPTLLEVSRRWLSLDLDGVPLPAGIDRLDLAACARAVLPMLPQALRQATLIVQATASHGMKPGARLRIWGWCDRPLSGVECRRWFLGVPVDAALFRPAQVNYTAAPVFAAGAVDPLPQRLLRLPGSSNVIATPSAATLAPPPRPAVPRAPASVAGGSRYALAALTRACGNIARQSEGSRHPTAVSEAWGLARLVKGGLLTEGEVARAVDGALRSAGKPDGEGQAIVAWAVAQRADSGNLPAGGARVMSDTTPDDIAPDDAMPTRDRAAEALEIARLAALDPLDYDRERQAAADRLGCRVGTLDEQVKAARPQVEAAMGRGVTLAEVEPWPDPVDTDALLSALSAIIRSHVILPQTMADAVALWCAHTWVYARFQHTPRLSVTSPTKRCGKSTLMDILRTLCCRSLKADSISASGVFRTVEALAPLTLLIDEADTFLGDNEELCGILNSGFEASGQVIRVVEVKDEWQPIRFATFAPVALAGIGTLPGTLEDRALPIVLQRKAASETVTRMRAPGARDRLQTLARRLARWAGDRGSHLNGDPNMPAELGDREADVSVPLVAIADDAGPTWAARARKALLDVYGRRTKEEGTLETGALLLADIKAVFAATKNDRIASEDLCRALADMEERPWPEWKQGKPITPPQLARALKPFGPRPGTIRMPSGATPKGYYTDAFKLVWERYLQPAPAADAQTATDSRHTATMADFCGFPADFEPPHDDSCGGTKSQKYEQKQSCGGVAAKSPLGGGQGGVAGANRGWEGTL